MPWSWSNLWANMFFEGWRACTGVEVSHSWLATWLNINYHIGITQNCCVDSRKKFNIHLEHNAWGGIRTPPPFFDLYPHNRPGCKVLFTASTVQIPQYSLAIWAWCDTKDARVQNSMRFKATLIKYPILLRQLYILSLGWQAMKSLTIQKVWLLLFFLASNYSLPTSARSDFNRSLLLWRSSSCCRLRRASSSALNILSSCNYWHAVMQCSRT